MTKFYSSKLDIVFTNQIWMNIWPEVRVDFHNGSMTLVIMVLSHRQKKEQNPSDCTTSDWRMNPS